MLTAAQEALVRESYRQYAGKLGNRAFSAKALSVLFIALMIIYCFIAHARDSFMYIYIAAIFGLVACVNIWFAGALEHQEKVFRGQS